jgi:voltage-gated potassium channel
LLALALVPILLGPFVFSLSATTKATLTAIDYLIWGIFAVDLIVKVAVAPARLGYLRRHWLDVVLVAVPFLRPLRVARSARALRLLRAGRVVVAVSRLGVGARRIFVRHGLHYVLAAALVIIVLAALLVTSVERGHEDATITDLPDGLWGALTTVTTVGYGDTYPKTDVGRGMGVILMLLGISIFGAVTANIAAFFVEEREDALMVEVRALREELRLQRKRQVSPPSVTGETGSGE